MLSPASSEFVALCRSQVALLTQALRASLSVVYLAQELQEGAEAKLIPIVAYPETAAVWEDTHPLALVPSTEVSAIAPIPRLLQAAPPAMPPARPKQDSRTPSLGSDAQAAPDKDWDENSWPQQGQIVLPLIHEGVVMGLLVTSREDQPWNEREIAQIERIAHTLTLAYILDKRSQWLEQKYRQQQLLQAQQQDLLDNLLHQLRNPLTALRTFGKLLLRRLLPKDANRDIANSIIRESDRLQELLLQMERATDPDAGEPALPPAPRAADRQPPAGGSVPLLPASPLESHAVAEVLQPLLLSAAAIAGERQLTLKADIPPDLPPVLCHPKALLEVLSNLTDNALKYTRAGGQIYIRAGDRQKAKAAGELPPTGDNFSPSPHPSEMMAIAISDTGPGIPPQDLQRLFQRHYRGVQAQTEIPGTGLGLAIAKDLLEQMQGEIEVFSPALSRWLPTDTPQVPATGPGTTFVVWLPVARQS
ncbi:GAF domain-containing sensor histidine kinase [Kamptonema formosum]|uniref:GAF domain-containing sensor histidine kinase n=1 Tax=Kamptonema formosum TaxID=331992 RepID=UPI00036C0DAC|nr:GAF domain-containing sensor histidine kinase [Oscillatoria sp. PCC 10802]